MVSVTSAGNDLFGKETPAVEELKKLWPLLNSSERSRIGILEKAAQHKDPLAATQSPSPIGAMP